MAARLEITHGLVSESDRLSTSSDTLSVTRPATGSETRTKGVLYLVVSSAVAGPRAREVTQRVAEVIGREYYYDESAGVPICLEKAIRAANRKLRGSREGGGLPPGALGIGVAVVRNSELYLAAVGGIDAYLVRAARLLMPEREAGPGLPAGDGLRVDVWRGEMAVGDVLVLASRHLTETVGTDELRNAVLTLHPQSAVEHLHHLFVAAGGQGSDAALVVEAGELTSRSERRRAGAVPDAFGDLPPPPPDPVAGAATVLDGAVGSARAAMLQAVDRVIDAMPSREASTARIRPAVSRHESQRRAAIGVLAFLGVIVTLGMLVWVLPRGVEREIFTVSTAEAAFIAARESAAEAEEILERDGRRALSLYRDAWRDLRRAETAGLPASTTAELSATVRAGLDGLYAARTGTTRTILAFDEGVDPGGLVRGPDGVPYFSDRATNSVTRVNPENGAAAVIGTAGSGGWGDVQAIHLLTAGGPDVVILDVAGDAWRWRPSNRRGRGTLAPLRLGGDARWGEDAAAAGTYVLPGQRSGGLYNLYIADPPSNQILRYSPTADASGFGAPVGYLVTDNPDVADFRHLLIDGDIYALTEGGVLKHNGGRLQADYQLHVPPDDQDVRPGHDYRVGDASRGRGSGRVYLYDAAWARILIFEKSDGRYVSQWSVGDDAPPMDDLRGMYIVEPTRQRDPVAVIWVSPEGLFETRLAQPRPRDQEG
jgi:hypothetical protein